MFDENRRTLLVRILVVVFLSSFSFFLESGYCNWRTKESNGIKNFESSPEPADRWIEGLPDYIHPPSPSYLPHTTTHTILFHYYITNITSLMTKHIRYLSAHIRSTISFFASMSYQYHYKYQNTILTNQNQTHTPPQHNRHISLNSHCSLSNEAKGITKERGYVVMITNELMLA